MGLLAIKNGNEDHQAVLDIANGVAILWNQHGGTDHGFSLLIGRNQVVDCCTHGTKLLDRHFSRPPGPFKRIAALVVLARLDPFFQFEPNPPSVAARAEWLARICALLIPAAFSVLRVNIARSDEDEKWVNLDQWNGFPSPHMKMDFISWLQWLDNFDDIARPLNIEPADWNFRLEERVGRMILATSLMLESFYYCSEGCSTPPSPQHLRSKCRACLEGITDLTPLAYDSLMEISRARQTTEE